MAPEFDEPPRLSSRNWLFGFLFWSDPCLTSVFMVKDFLDDVEVLTWLSS
jgi:hypothetical protein